MISGLLHHLLCLISAVLFGFELHCEFLEIKCCPIEYLLCSPQPRTLCGKGLDIRGTVMVVNTVTLLSTAMASFVLVI